MHSSYNRSEILAALGIARFGGQMPGAFAQGVVWCPEIKTDALLITLEKNEKDFSATTRYKDYAMSPTLFPLGVTVRDQTRIGDRQALSAAC